MKNVMYLIQEMKSLICISFIFYQWLIVWNVWNFNSNKGNVSNKFIKKIYSHLKLVKLLFIPYNYYIKKYFMNLI